MIVVPVLMTNCQVSLKWKMGPITAQTMIAAVAKMKVTGRPVTRAAPAENFANQEPFDVALPENDPTGRLDLNVFS